MTKTITIYGRTFTSGENTEPTERVLTAAVKRVAHMVGRLDDVFRTITPQLVSFDNTVAAVPDEKGIGHDEPTIP